MEFCVRRVMLARATGSTSDAAPSPPWLPPAQLWLRRRWPVVVGPWAARHRHLTDHAPLLPAVWPVPPLQEGTLINEGGTFHHRVGVPLYSPILSATHDSARGYTLRRSAALVPPAARNRKFRQAVLCGRMDVISLRPSMKCCGKRSKWIWQYTQTRNRNAALQSS